MISAFGIDHGVISKSQKMNGQYKPVTQMGRTERRLQHARLKQGVHPGALRAAWQYNSQPAGRGLSDVYRSHGVSHGAHLFGEKTEPSAKHKNVEYGHSVHPAHRLLIDRSINPKLLPKHKVVFHATDMQGKAAAAASRHVTTGGKARVVIDHHQFTNAFKSGNGSIGHVINHELAHLQPRRVNPAKQHSAVSSAGEEARADRIAGTHGYSTSGFLRQGKVAPARSFRRVSRLLRK